jgi:predicted amidophosphoribosyltransferase
MAFLDPSLNNPNSIKYCGKYQPYRIRDSWGNLALNSNFDRYSGLVLDLKEGKPEAIEYFYNLINPIIKNNIAIACVPSHDPQKVDSGIKRLAIKLASSGNRIDATSCLIRHTKIAKLATGGDREKNVHLNSIKATNLNLIRNRTVLIIDDVTTTHNSLLACQEILLQSGATNVQCLAVAQTEGY